MRLKEFLSESYLNIQFDAKHLDHDDLIALYKNAGYEVSQRDRKLFLDSKYGGFRNGKHSYIMFMENDDNDGYYLTRFFVEIGAEGKLIAEPAGVPFFESDNRDEVEAEFERAGSK